MLGEKRYCIWRKDRKFWITDSVGIIVSYPTKTMAIAHMISLAVPKKLKAIGRTRSDIFEVKKL